MTVTTTKSPINIVQITDTHLYGRSTGALLKMNTRNALDHVIEMVKEIESDIDLVVATGDIAQDASVAAYNNFTHAIERLHAPYRWIPGNHDDAAVMARVAKGTQANERLVHINNWLILLLDTSIEGQVHGVLSKAELDFLESSLQSTRDNAEIEHCLICLHHNPISASADWMQDIGLQNDEEFFEILERFDKVNCAIYGHIHQDLDLVRNGIRYLCSPSTCIQFKPNVANFSLEKLNPGYRSLQLFPDGSIKSEVHRVAGTLMKADFDCTGY
jgi:Icc protein